MSSQAVADQLPPSGHLCPGAEWSFRLGGKPVLPDANLIDGHRVDAKTIEVLVTLADAAPRPVPASVLMNKVWPNVVVGDNVVHQAMTNIRRALDDDARQPLFIETVPRKGYRLIAAIEWADDRVVAKPKRRTRGVAYAMIAFFALAASSILGAAYVGIPLMSQQATELKLTVMPFAHVGADHQQRYLNQSIYDEIVANLSSVDTITLVGSRASLEQTTDERVPAMVKRLGSTHILEGSTRIVDGGKVRINVRLLDAGRETHVWGGSYELAAQGNFQQVLADRIGNAVLAAMEGRSSSDIETYETFTQPW